MARGSDVGGRGHDFGHREIDRAALIAHTAHDELDEAVKSAMIERDGFDGTYEGFVRKVMSTLQLDQN